MKTHPSYTTKMSYILLQENIKNESKTESLHSVQII